MGVLASESLPVSKCSSFGRTPLAFVLVIAAAVPARRVLACGASGGGAAGISGCSLDEHEEGARLKWRLGADYSFTSTALHFDSGLKVDQVRNASLITLDYGPARRVRLQRLRSSHRRRRRRYVLERPHAVPGGTRVRRSNLLAL